MVKKNRSFLKWAGNKYHCLEHIVQALPETERLIEPFAGSAAVFLNVNYPNYVLAEKNADLMALFHYLQQEGEIFILDCLKFFCQKNNNSAQYYYLREQFNQTTDKRQRALLFLYLNRHGYNGLCRYNQQGKYNVPFGRYPKPYFPHQEMRLFHQRSQTALLRHQDFRDTFKEAVAGDVIYCDPPYVPLSASANFSAYTEHKFTETEQIELAKLALIAAEQGVTVIISNHDTAFTRHHYRQAKIHSFMVKRQISCQSMNRQFVPELLAIFAP